MGLGRGSLNNKNGKIMNLITPMREFLTAVPSSDTTVAAATVAALTSGAASLVTQSWTMQLFGIQPTVMFACFCGAAVALRFLPKMNRAGMFSALAIGTLSGAFGTPWLASWLGTQHFNTIGFLIGLGAHLIFSIIFDNAPAWLNKLVSFKTGGDK